MKLETVNKESNYLAKIVKIDSLRKHSNADRLQCANVDFQNVILGLDANYGDEYVFFPLECTISLELLKFTNSMRDKTLNKDTSKSGFFELNGRVRAIKLRGEKSMGFMMPLEEFKKFAFDKFGEYPEIKEGQEFDSIGSFLVVEKYEVKKKVQQGNKNQGNTPHRVSRIIDGHIKLHVNTSNLRKSVYELNIDDNISITYKTHGTSFWVANALVKKKLNLKEKFAKMLGVDIVDSEYDYVYGSRKVVKNEYLEDSKNKQHFYSYDLWKDICDRIKESIPKGFTLYGECIGFTKDGAYIQKDYDYMCEGKSNKIEIYRITQTNADGESFELTYNQIDDFCNRYGLTASKCFYTGTIFEYLQEEDLDFNEDNWREVFIKNLEEKYNEKDCYMCSNEVPEEGIVVRRENLFSCDSFKLKSFRFLSKETEELDKGIENIEE